MPLSTSAKKVEELLKGHLNLQARHRRHIEAIRSGEEFGANNPPVKQTTPDEMPSVGRMSGAETRASPSFSLGDSAEADSPSLSDVSLPAMRPSGTESTRRSSTSGRRRHRPKRKRPNRGAESASADSGKLPSGQSSHAEEIDEKWDDEHKGEVVDDKDEAPKSDMSDSRPVKKSDRPQSPGAPDTVNPAQHRNQLDSESDIFASGNKTASPGTDSFRWADRTLEGDAAQDAPEITSTALGDAAHDNAKERNLHCDHEAAVAETQSEPDMYEYKHGEIERPPLRRFSSGRIYPRTRERDVDRWLRGLDQDLASIMTGARGTYSDTWAHAAASVPTSDTDGNENEGSMTQLWDRYQPA